MTIVRVFHFISVFIWIGNLLCLSRLFAFYVKEAPEVQVRLLPMFKRMYYYVQLPTLVIALATGFTLLSSPTFKMGGWFHLKLTGVVLLVIVDTLCRQTLTHFGLGKTSGKGTLYKALHGIAGLALIAIAIAIAALKPRPAIIPSSSTAEVPTKELAKIEAVQYDHFLTVT